MNPDDIQAWAQQATPGEVREALSVLHRARVNRLRGRDVKPRSRGDSMSDREMALASAAAPLTDELLQAFLERPYTARELLLNAALSDGQLETVLEAVLDRLGEIPRFEDWMDSSGPARPSHVLPTEEAVTNMAQALRHARDQGWLPRETADVLARWAAEAPAALSARDRDRPDWYPLNQRAQESRQLLTNWSEAPAEAIAGVFRTYREENANALAAELVCHPALDARHWKRWLEEGVMNRQMLLATLPDDRWAGDRGPREAVWRHMDDNVWMVSGEPMEPTRRVYRHLLPHAGRGEFREEFRRLARRDPLGAIEVADRTGRADQLVLTDWLPVLSGTDPEARRRAQRWLARAADRRPPRTASLISTSGETN